MYRFTFAARRGFSLIELTLTVAVVAVLAAVGIALLSVDVDQQLATTGQVVASDLAWARNLAVSNSSTYRVTFEPASNKYVLRNSSGDLTLLTLPSSPFRRSDDHDYEQTTKLADLPSLSRDVALCDPNDGATPQVEFTALGSTTNTAPTTIWLTAGTGARQRYLPVTINPTTGLVALGSVQSTSPVFVNNTAAMAATSTTTSSSTSTASTSTTSSSAARTSSSDDDKSTSTTTSAATTTTDDGKGNGKKK